MSKLPIYPRVSIPAKHDLIIAEVWTEWIADYFPALPMFDSFDAANES